jgi:hypothetical protein
MRFSPLLRIAVGAALLAAVILAALLLTRRGAEAPDNVAIPTEVSLLATNVPPSPTFEPSPAPTADVEAQRAALLSDTRLAEIVSAGEDGDIETLLGLMLKVNFCERPTRDNRETCANVDYLEAVQQPLGHTYPALRPTSTMHEWLTSLFASGAPRLTFALRSVPGGDPPPDAYVLFFRLPEASSETPEGDPYWGYVLLHLRLETEQPIEMISFLIWEADPAEYVLNELVLAPISYEVILGTCHPKDRFHCE